MPITLKDWVKRFKTQKEAIEYIQKRTGLSERHIRRFLKGYKTQKFPTALRLSKATGLPIEEFLFIPKNLFQENQAQSVEEKEKTTVEVNK